MQTLHVFPQSFEFYNRWLLSTWFVFSQQNILCENFYTSGIICGGKCVVSEREICLKVEKNEIWTEHADQKHNIKQINSCQTSNV